MKTTKYASILLLIVNLTTLPSYAQKVRLKNIWHYQKGDYPQSNLSNILRKQKLILAYNEIVVLEFDEQPSDSKIYQYRITPTDNHNKWRQITREPVIVLPHLEGGNYHLEIRYNTAILADIPITVEQALWQEWWFIPSIVFYVSFLIGVGVYLLLRYNFRQKLKVQYIRNSIAADLHDEVGSNLTSIAIFVELLRRKCPPEIFPILDKISNNSTESVQLMRDTIWAIQAKNDDFELFVAKLKSLASELLGAKDIALTFTSKLENTKATVPMEQRKNAYLIYKEAINNIVKHSNASKVIIEIFLNNQMIWLHIQDNGCGFDTNKISEGNGLCNFVNRAEANNMLFDIKSEINQGTVLTLKIPLV